MSATDYQIGRYPLGIAELPVKNTSGAAMTLGTNGAGPLVKLDTTNPMSATQGQLGVVLTAAVTDTPLGVLIENIPSGGQGRVQVLGCAWCIAAGAITIGAIVGPSAVTSGDVTTYTVGDPYIGQALTAAAVAGDPILVHLMPRGAT